MISVLFPYVGDDGPRDVLFSWVLRWWQNGFPEAQICIGRNFDVPFNRGLARNDAFDQSTGSVLIIADADTVPTVAGVRDGIAEVVATKCWSLPYAENRYYNLSEEWTAELLTDRRDPSDIAEPEDPDQYEHKITSWAGCLILPREAWETVGGYDPRFNGWGYEDNAMMVKLDTLWGPHRRQDSYCCHLWHPISKGTTFDSPHIQHNRNLFRQFQAGNFS